MSIIAFGLLALLAIAAIAYPLLPGQIAKASAAVITDHEIEMAVRKLRDSRSKANSSCPRCRAVYQPGDRFCIKCGEALSEASSVVQGRRQQSLEACTACGALVRSDDSFCPKCGQPAAVQESG
jgi:RNA polymerase subunit RPABC4/transcription elongation factor Spt4